MKPGATTRPSASIVRRADCDARPMAVILPPAIETSARRAGAPVPSTRVPLRIRRSSTSLLIIGSFRPGNEHRHAPAVLAIAVAEESHQVALLELQRDQDIPGRRD